MDSYKPREYAVGSKKSSGYLLPGLAVSAAFAIVYLLFFRTTSLEQVGAGALVKKAVVILSPGADDSKVSGTVTFEQASLSGPVTVSGKLTGLDANAKRGFHIHQFGDLTKGCDTASSHFNPFKTTHGAPADGRSNRHVGDLGNIQSDGDGVAEFSFSDSLLSINGPFSIVGRSVVLHKGTDDLGKGGDDESLKTGNAGGRAACGVIGLSQ